MHRSRPRRRRALLALAAVAVIATACNDSGTPLEVDSLDTLSPSERELVATAEEWIEEEADLTLDEGDELVFSRLDEGPGVSHVAFGHEVRDHLVLGSELIVHVLTDGTIQGSTDALTHSRPTDDGEPAVEREEAEETAVKSFDREAEPIGQPDLAWRDIGDLQLVWRVQVTLEDPPEVWQVLVDATTGEVVETDELTQTHRQAADSCEVPTAPSGCIFDPDPVSAAAGEAVTPADANRFLEGVQIEGLTDPSSGLLSGEYVNVNDPNAPENAPPEPDGTWAVGRGEPGFEHVMVYSWIDRAQRLIQRLGFTDVRNGPIVAYAVDHSYVDNAHYDPANQRLEFGISGANGTSFAEDAQIVLHEYGHALLGAQAPGLSVGAPGDGDAYHEAFGDLFAYLMTLADREGDGECLGAWNFDGQCIRRLDGEGVTPDDKVYEEHADAEILTGAVHDILVALLDDQGLTVDDCIDTTACDQVTDRMLTTLLSTNGYISDYVAFDEFARYYLEANDATYGGADADTIASAFSAHGIDPAGTAADEVAVNLEIFHEDRSELTVYAGVQDPSGEDLCEPITLWDPSDRPAYSKLRGRFDVSGTECAALGAPSAGQHWFVQIADGVPQAGNGIVAAVSISHGTEQYTVPSGHGDYIPDGDPAGITILVDGSGEAIVPPVDPPDPVDPETDPFVSFSITHPYVGDLLVRAGVAGADGVVTCAVTAAEPTAGLAGGGGLAGDINLGDCAGEYPPSEQDTWFFAVADVGPLDEGTVDVLTLTGPDGEVREIRAGDLPAAIPDADQAGLVFTWTQ